MDEQLALPPKPDVKNVVSGQEKALFSCLHAEQLGSLRDPGLLKIVDPQVMTPVMMVMEGTCSVPVPVVFCVLTHWVLTGRTALLPISQTRKVRHREVKALSQGHTDPGSPKCLTTSAGDTKPAQWPCVLASESGTEPSLTPFRPRVSRGLGGHGEGHGCGAGCLPGTPALPHTAFDLEELNFLGFRFLHG